MSVIVDIYCLNVLKCTVVFFCASFELNRHYIGYGIFDDELCNVCVSILPAQMSLVELNKMITAAKVYVEWSFDFWLLIYIYAYYAYSSQAATNFRWFEHNHIWMVDYVYFLQKMQMTVHWNIVWNRIFYFLIYFVELFLSAI